MAHIHVCGVTVHVHCQGPVSSSGLATFKTARKLAHALWTSVTDVETCVFADFTSRSTKRQSIC